MRKFDISQFALHSYNQAVFETSSTQGGLAQVVERSICIREAPGSIPGFSIFTSLAKTPHTNARTPVGVSPIGRAQDVAYSRYIVFELLFKSAETRD